MLKKIKNLIIIVRAVPCYYCFLLLLFLAIYTQIDSYQYEKSIKLAVGKEDGAYYVYAKEYAKELKEYGVDLEIVTTLGAKEAQKKVALGEVDFAFVQGGVEDLNKGILALANVAHEPIWVLTRRSDDILTFSDLKDKKINICNPMSGTNPIAVKLLDELLGKNNYTPREESVNQAFIELKAGKIDAMFYVIARSSLSLQNKIKDEDIRIMHFENAESIRKYFIMSDMNEEENLYYKTVMLKKHSLHPLKKLPAQDKRLLVKRTLLVTKKSSDEMVRLFLKIAKKVHSREAFFHDENYFINSRGLKYEQHKASKRYFEEPTYRYERSSLVSWFREGKKGFWLAQTLQKIEDAILVFIVPLGLMAFFIEVIYPISKIYTRRGINRWYRKINKMDTNIDGFLLEELEEKSKQLKVLLVEVQNKDDIDAVHLESYYAIHQQIREMIENFEVRIRNFQTK